MARRSACHAITAAVETPRIFIWGCGSARPCAKAIAARMPEKEPGPMARRMAESSAGTTEAVAKREWTEVAQGSVGGRVSSRAAREDARGGAEARREAGCAGKLVDARRVPSR